MSELLSLAEAARTLPNRPHTAAIWRYCRRGLKTRNGECLRLPHQRIGGRLYVDRADLQHFFKRVADADLEYFSAEAPAPSIPKIRSAEKRDAECNEAMAELAAAGVKIGGRV